MCSVRRVKNLRKEERREVTEFYMVEASSFGEAEARAAKEVGQYSYGSPEVLSIYPSAFTDIVPSASLDALTWYGARIMVYYFDKRSRERKEVKKMSLLIQARDMDDARRMTGCFMSDTGEDWECECLEKMEIEDVYLK